MNRTMLRISKLLLTVMMLSALIFTGCSCGKKESTKETNKKGVAATIINEDGSVEYVEDIIKDGESNADDEENVNDIVGSDDNGKKSDSGKSDSSKSGSKKSSSKKSSSKKSDSKKSDSKKSNGSSSSSSSKKSDSKKSDSKKSDSKSDDKEKTTKKSNFDIEKSDNDNRFGPIIDGKKKK